jgi:drug/metabolite transporter (DMT)-like permease
MRIRFNNPVLYALIVAFLLGIGAPFTKLLLDYSDPIALAALLYLGSGTGLLVVRCTGALTGRVRDHIEAPLRKSDLVWLCGGILIGGVAAPLTLMYSLPQTPAATASLLINFEAVATTVIAAVVFGEHIGRRVWTALVSITASCLLLTWDPGSPIGISLSATGILLASAFFALDSNLSQKISSKDPFPVAIVKGLAAAAVSFAIVFLVGQRFPDPVVGIIAMLFGFLSFGGLISVLFLMAIRGIGTARAGSLLAISPLFGVLLSLLIFPARPAGLFLPAVFLMVIGVWLLLSEKHSHPHRHPAEVHEHRHRHDDLHHCHGHTGSDPPLSPAGEHSHSHRHEEIVHEHPHRPDIHHRHRHGAG